MQVNPLSPTDYERNADQLQAFWIFCLIVAGKNSDWAARTVTKFLKPKGEYTPLKYVRMLGEGLRNTLVANKVGQYNRIDRALRESADLEEYIGLHNATLDDLLKVFGVGPKTARFFLLHTRPNCEVAVLDTHILKYLRTYHEDAPKSTPTTKKAYEEWEQIYLQHIKADFPYMTPAQVDLLLWTKFSGRLDDETLIGKNAYKTDLP